MHLCTSSSSLFLPPQLTSHKANFLFFAASASRKALLRWGLLPRHCFFVHSFFLNVGFVYRYVFLRISSFFANNDVAKIDLWDGWK